MRLTIVTELNRPPASVFRAYIDPDLLKAWQQNLVDIEPVSGTPGQPGAESRLTYREKNGPVTMTATVIDRQEPGLFAVLTDGRHLTVASTSRFADLGGGRTEWTLEVEVRFKGLLVRLLSPLVKKGLRERLEANARRFKRKLEAGEFDG